MIDNSKIKDIILKTYSNLVKIGGNKVCIIKREIKNNTSVYSGNKLTANKIKYDYTTIDGTFECFFIAQPVTIISEEILGAEYSNKLMIDISSIRNSVLKTIYETDEIYINISDE